MKKNLLSGFLLMAAVSVVAQTIDNAFFDKVNYRGAFGTTNWAANWTNFDPKTTDYPTTETTLSGDYSADKTLGSPLYGVSSFTDAAVSNSFFTKVDYIGAFGKTNWTAGWANFDPKNTAYPSTNSTAPSEITSNTTWVKTNVYLLSGFVRVKSGATLTIEPGTVIRGDKSTTGTLIVEPGAKLIAVGTEAEPIVFTSNQASGSRSYGDWGGVVLAGNAPVNQTSPAVEGGIGTIYGGTDTQDNSGKLQYVRIEFPGVALTTTSNSEINGLTMCGVGSGTTIDYVQVSYSGDDSFEWFGGNVNAKHLIAFRGWDDDFDTDFGYSGMVQFGVSLRDPLAADQSKSNSFESDNDGSGSTKTPFTSPVFSNVSSFGPLATSTTPFDSQFQAAMHLRRSTKIKIYNSVFAGWPKGLIVDGANSQASADAGDLVIKNTVISASTTNFAPTPTTWGEEAWFNTATFKNALYADNSSLLVVNPFNLLTPDYTLSVGSPLLTGSYWQITGIFTPKSTSVNSLKIYPNPASTEVMVELPEFSGVTSIEVRDLTGKLLLSKNAISMEKEVVNVSELRKGMYIMVARQGETSYNQKLTIR